MDHSCRSCLGLFDTHLLGKPSRNELARFIETQEPALREDLLSAIELGSNRSNPEFDSEVFRQLLQRDGITYQNSGHRKDPTHGPYCTMA